MPVHSPVRIQPARSPRTRSRRTAAGRAAPARRRGLSTATMLVGMTTLLASAGVAVDLAVLNMQKSMATTTVEAAVLAGAAELWDRSALHPALRELDLPPGHAGESIQAQQARLARQAAVQCAAQNTHSDRQLVLPVDVSVNLQGQPCNWLRIECPLTKARGNPLTRCFGQTLGHPAMEAVITREARLDQRVYGLAPTGCRRRQECSVPMAPLMIDPQTWQTACQADAVLVKISVNSPGMESGNGRLLSLCPPQLPGVSLSATQAADGLRQDDLASLGGAFILRDGILDLAPAQDACGTVLRSLGVSLCAKGPAHRFVFPLGGPGPGNSRRVVALAAGRVAGADYNPQSQQLTVAVRPCLLTTATALVRDGQPVNPWIGKIYLAPP